MAITSTAFNGCDAVIKLDNASGTLTTISSSSNEVQMNFKQMIGRFKSFGSDWKGSVVCGKDVDITLKIITSSASDEAWDIINNWFHGANSGTARTFVVQYPDSSSGSSQFSGEVNIEEVPMTVGAEGAEPGMFSIKLVPAGEITYSTI